MAQQLWARLGFAPRLLDLRQGYSRTQLLRDVGAGLTVAMVALPLAMAFAIASGLPPQVGLFTAMIGGLVISVFSGSPVQIGGPAGAFIVVVYGIVQQHGVGGLLSATLLSGVMLWLMGVMRLGVLIKFIPVAVIIGFTNGIAVLIALSQLADFLGLSLPDKPAAFLPLLKALWHALPSFNPDALLMGLSALLVMVLWQFVAPKHLRGRLHYLALIPASLMALVLALLEAQGLGLKVETIGSRFGGIEGGLPSFAWPSMASWATLWQPALTLALLGAIESLLCARVADHLLNDRHHANQELMAQGFANLLTPCFGGMPATGTIARTVTNIKSGGRTPIAGITHALVLLLVLVLLAPWAQYIPLPSLAAILLFVAWNMGEWRAFAELRHYRLPYRMILLLVFGLTVVVDLTVAVGVGLVLSALVFMFRISQLTEMVREPIGDGVERVRITGTLFFGAVQHLERLESALPRERLVLDLSGVIYIDSTGAEALSALWKAAKKQKIILQIEGLRPQAEHLLSRTGLLAQLAQQSALEQSALEQSE